MDQQQRSSAEHEVKKVCRRKGRKPSALRKEYLSRQKDKKWLETHIWHAKRMHMETQWGYRIAQSCCDKGLRANYRFMKHGCLISVS